MKPKSIDELVELNLLIKDGLKYIVQKALIQGKINNDICQNKEFKILNNQPKSIR